MAQKEHVLVVGGGTMGRGIAGVCALAGYPTAIFEADAPRRAAMRPAIERSWERAIARGRLSREAVARAKGLIVVPESLEETGGARLALEAVPEELGLKLQVFSELDRICPDAEFLASNTSALSITEIASSTRKPERVVGLHFFNPVAAMALVEVVRGNLTSEDVLERATVFAESLGKEPIRVSDTPGFATSRLGVALGLEAMRMVEEGVASASDIDRAIELGYGHRMGPLKTSDLVGLDVRLAIAETFAAGIDGRRFAPPAILRRLVDEGKTGKKSGQGFYRWEGDAALPVDSERKP